MYLYIYIYIYIYIYKGDFTLGGISALRLTISKQYPSDLAYDLQSILESFAREQIH